MSDKKLQQAIQKWRATSGLTQDEAANYLGVSRRTLQGYESGERGCPKSKALVYIPVPILTIGLLDQVISRAKCISIETRLV